MVLKQATAAMNISNGKPPGAPQQKDLMTLKWDVLNILVNAVINGSLGLVRQICVR